MKTKEFTQDEIEALVTETEHEDVCEGSNGDNCYDCQVRRLAALVLHARAELDASRRWARAWKDLAESKARALRYVQNTQRTYYDAVRAHGEAVKELAECRAQLKGAQEAYGSHLYCVACKQTTTHCACRDCEDALRAECDALKAELASCVKTATLLQRQLQTARNDFHATRHALSITQTRLGHVEDRTREVEIKALEWVRSMRADKIPNTVARLIEARIAELRKELGAAQMAETFEEEK